MKVIILFLILAFMNIGGCSCSCSCNGDGEDGGPGPAPTPTPAPIDGSCDYTFSFPFTTEQRCEFLATGLQCDAASFAITVPGEFPILDVSECNGIQCLDCLCSAIDMGPFSDLTGEECADRRDLNNCFSETLTNGQCQLFDCLQDTPCGNFFRD
ncbi:hypothetical protein MYX76_17360 [Desulfobacterota bacterium AH_259_B03_O07]|nr:hypothetical protein [Desulfobacterota bacterium AH_259_B03_O07]